MPPATAPIESGVNQSFHSLKLAPGVSVSALVVDDVKENRDILSQILTDAGITVSEAVNGQDALDALHQSNALPDLIFMDIRMPIMNGIKAMQTIKHEFKDRCPICIVITAQAMQQDVARYLNEGFNHYIAKPFRFEAVYECIHQSLDVEFDVQDEPAQPAPPSAQIAKQQPTDGVDLSTLNIPPALYQAIVTAATTYEISKLEGCLNELTDLNPAGRQFAEALQQYVSTYDMTGLLSELEKVIELEKLTELKKEKRDDE